MTDAGLSDRDSSSRAPEDTDEQGAYIERLVDQAPPLSADQRDRLAILLRPSGDVATSA